MKALLRLIGLWAPPHLAERLLVRNGGPLRQKRGRSSKAKGFNCHCSQTRRGVSFPQIPRAFQITRHQQPTPSKLRSKALWTSPLASPGGGRLGMWEHRKFLGTSALARTGSSRPWGVPSTDPRAVHLLTHAGRAVSDSRPISTVANEAPRAEGQRSGE